MATMITNGYFPLALRYLCVSELLNLRVEIKLANFVELALLAVYIAGHGVQGPFIQRGV